VYWQYDADFTSPSMVSIRADGSGRTVRGPHTDRLKPDCLNSLDTFRTGTPVTPKVAIKASTATL